MRLPNKFRDLAEQLAVENEMLKQELNLERARRISSEAISEERRLRAERSELYANRAEEARDGAIRARIESVDLVNTALLKAIQPDQGSHADIKSFKPIQKDKRQSVPTRRDLDRKFMVSYLDKFNNPKKPLDPTEAAKDQMDVLGLGKLVQNG